MNLNMDEKRIDFYGLDPKWDLTSAPEKKIKVF